jgi:hypothetical protein
MNQPKRWAPTGWLKLFVKRPEPMKPKPEAKKLPKWVVIFDGRRFYPHARTKSEARAVVKKELGIKRLPVGAVVYRKP